MKFPYNEDRFICEYGIAKYIPVSFKDECINTAKRINEEAKAAGLIPTICLSGGLDSEVIVKSFIDAGVDFRLATFRFPDKLNEHELAYVNMFCKRHNLQTEFLDIDIKNFIVSEEAEKIFVETRAKYLPYVSHIKLIQHIWNNGGYPVVGEEGQLERAGTEWSYVEHEHDRTLFRYCEIHDIEGCMGFLQHTPEILLAMFQDPRMVELGLGKNKLANILLYTSRKIKYEMYIECWPNLVPRPKMTGAERIEQLVAEHTRLLYVKYGTDENRHWKMSYTDFINILIGKISDDK